MTEYDQKVLSEIFPQVPLMKEYSEVIEELADYKADREFILETMQLVENCFGTLNDPRLHDGQVCARLRVQLEAIFYKYEMHTKDY